MSEDDMTELANQIARSFGDVEDGLNVADALNNIALAITSAARDLGNGGAATPMGAIEAHGLAIKEAANVIAEALSAVAMAIEAVG